MTLAQKLNIDADGDRAPFDQVRLGILDLIANGELIVGERLPTVRALAEHLGDSADVPPPPAVPEAPRTRPAPAESQAPRTRTPEPDAPRPRPDPAVPAAGSLRVLSLIHI